MPPHEHDSQLHAVLSFYCSVVSVTPEGDSIVSEETLEGLGMDHFRSLFTTLFGSLLRVAYPSEYSKPPELSSLPHANQSANSLDGSFDSPDAYSAAEGTADQVQAMADTLSEYVDAGTYGQTSTGVLTKQMKYRLTDFVPDPGYFLAGAIAGGVSRTATAPLDRLKVYLLVNTSSRLETAGAALKQGRPLVALKNAMMPFNEAIRVLYRSGGIASFFAGECLTSSQRGCSACSDNIR